MRRNGIIGGLGPTPKSQSFPLFWSQQSPHPSVLIFKVPILVLHASFPDGMLKRAMNSAKK